MTKKLNYPSTHLEDLSRTETRKLMDEIKYYVPEQLPAPSWQILLVIALFGGAFLVAVAIFLS